MPRSLLDCFCDLSSFNRMVNCNYATNAGLLWSEIAIVWHITSILTFQKLMAAPPEGHFHLLRPSQIHLQRMQIRCTGSTCRKKNASCLGFHHSLPVWAEVQHGWNMMNNHLALCAVHPKSRSRIQVHKKSMDFRLHSGLCRLWHDGKGLFCTWPSIASARRIEGVSNS